MPRSRRPPRRSRPAPRRRRRRPASPRREGRSLMRRNEAPRPGVVGAVPTAWPGLEAVALAAAGSLASGLPFLIVRKESKEYGTSNRVEGAYEEGDRVCLVEDVVTSGGALVEAVQALRNAGLVVRTALC